MNLKKIAKTIMFDGEHGFRRRLLKYMKDNQILNIAIVVTKWSGSSKIEKVPRGIRGEKSSKDMASSRNLVSTIGALASLKTHLPSTSLIYGGLSL